MGGEAALIYSNNFITRNLVIRKYRYIIDSKNKKEKKKDTQTFDLLTVITNIFITASNHFIFSLSITPYAISFPGK